MTRTDIARVAEILRNGIVVDGDTVAAVVERLKVGDEEGADALLAPSEHALMLDAMHRAHWRGV